MPVGNSATGHQTMFAFTRTWLGSPEVTIPFGSLRRGISGMSKTYLRSNRQSMKRKRKPMKSCDDWGVLISD